MQPRAYVAEPAPSPRLLAKQRRERLARDSPASAPASLERRCSHNQRSAVPQPNCAGAMNATTSAAAAVGAGKAAALAEGLPESEDAAGVAAEHNTEQMPLAEGARPQPMQQPPLDNGYEEDEDEDHSGHNAAADQQDAWEARPRRSRHTCKQVCHRALSESTCDRGKGSKQHCSSAAYRQSVTWSGLGLVSQRIATMHGLSQAHVLLRCWHSNIFFSLQPCTPHGANDVACPCWFNRAAGI